MSLVKVNTKYRTKNLLALVFYVQMEQYAEASHQGKYIYSQVFSNSPILWRRRQPPAPRNLALFSLSVFLSVCIRHASLGHAHKKYKQVRKESK